MSSAPKPIPGLSPAPLSSLRQRIESGQLHPGTRLESLRQAAARLGLTQHAVLTAYRQLADAGLVEARHGSGFYVASREGAPVPSWLPSGPGLDRLLDTALLIQGFVEPSALLKCGSGVLPREWLAPLELHRHLRAVAGQAGSCLYDYGSALGYPPLREALRRRLGRRRMDCSPDQVLLTAGITQGLELIVRGLCRPGDSVLVEDPGYYNLFGLLETSGLRLLPVPRTARGPDLDVLEALLRAGEAPKLFFLQSLLHNPTGGDLDPAAARRLLLLAERHGFLIAEDDAYADLAEDGDLRLAALDGWRRVLYLSGFTKTVSAGLRVGFVAGAGPVIEVLARAKLLTSIATSEFVERVIHRVLTDGGYDPFAAGMRRRLVEAQSLWQEDLEQAGWEIFPGHRRGYFVWAAHPRWADSAALARAAAAAGFWLAPGSAFDPRHGRSPWVRFNVAYRSLSLTAWLQAAGAR
jgi:DNA-binding transcriptional MocR family regulator